MLNHASGQNMFSTTQFDGMIKSLDEYLQIYTEALFVLSVVVIGLLVCLILYEVWQSKATKKIASNHQPFKGQSLNGRQLLQTEP